jgi:polyhydroxyalkanoate synthesis regulator phasin
MTKLSVERLERALKELLREKTLRLKLYPQWVKEGKLDEAQAKEQLEALDDAIQALKETFYKYKIMHDLMDIFKER